jgi:hypothetical protein
MSMQSWFDIGIANTPAEKEAAREKHRIFCPVSAISTDFPRLSTACSPASA